MGEAGEGVAGGVIRREALFPRKEEGMVESGHGVGNGAVNSGMMG